MYLSELELQGFKSFTQKTKVKFDTGITAIVGPNGCGKSNIVDALRWALGEQKASLLRSANMTNVIFNGTAKRKALGMAEVSVTIVNSHGILPTEFSDVTITRRLYRSGESEYLLNKAPCRLKDIIDLFMDTGMGAGAYSVIELKMVEEILNDKNNDRRRLFEEAAGITKYKERKKQTLRKLEATRNDLQRVDDILFEVRKKTRSLQTQAQKAERAHNYETELKQLESASAKEQHEDLSNQLQPIHDQITQARTDQENQEQKISELEQAHENAQQKLLELEKELSEAQQNLNRVSGKYKETQAEISYKEQHIENQRETIRQYEEDIVQAENEIKELKQDGREAEQMLGKAEEKLKEHQASYDKLKKQLEEANQSVEEVRGELEETNRAYEEQKSKISELQEERIRIQSQIESSRNQKERAEKEIEEKNERIRRQNEQQEEFSEKLKQAEKKLADAEKQVDQARSDRESIAKEQNQIKDELRSLRSRRDAIDSELKLLKRIAGSNEAMPPSFQFLNEQKSEFKVLQPLSEVFATDRKYAIALEAALGEACNYVIVENRSEADKAAQLLKSEEQGKATFIPLSELQADYTVDDDSLYHLVSCDPAYESLKQLFLGNVHLVKDLNNKANHSNGKIRVTLDGDLITREGFLVSGSSDEHEGMRVGLQDRLTELEKNREKVDHEIEDHEDKIEDLQRRYDQIDLNTKIREAREAEETLRKLQSQQTSGEAQFEVYKSGIEEQKSFIEETENSIRENEKKLSELEPRNEELQKQLQEIISRQESLKSKLREREENQKRVQQSFSDVQLKNQELQNEVDNFKRDIERSTQGVEQVKERLQKRADTASQGKDSILQMQEEIKEAKQSLESLSEQQEQARQEVEEAETKTSKQRGQINQLEQDLKDQRNKKDKTLSLLHRLEMEKNRIEMERNNLVEHIWQNYGLTIDQIEDTLPDDLTLQQARDKIATLKQRLNNIGTVNPLAIEEYEEEKERMEHYESQISDLKDAEEKLQDTIQEINDTARDRFNETFEKIRVNFQKVFNTLFQEGDICDLKIDDEGLEDPLEAKIEIVANPRGKRPSVIEQLSGGEKTLTAIALLFAIYLVKPSPFCILDEVDAPLDDHNIERFTNLLREFSQDTQFVVITHNKKTMEKAEMMYGVTMPETGVSKLVGVRLDDVAA